MDMLPNGIVIMKNNSTIYHNKKTAELFNIPINLEKNEQLIMVIHIIYYIKYI